MVAEVVGHSLPSRLWSPTLAAPLRKSPPEMPPESLHAAKAASSMASDFGDAGLGDTDRFIESVLLVGTKTEPARRAKSEFAATLLQDPDLLTSLGSNLAVLAQLLAQVQAAVPSLGSSSAAQLSALAPPPAHARSSRFRTALVISGLNTHLDTDALMDLNSKLERGMFAKRFDFLSVPFDLVKNISMCH